MTTNALLTFEKRLSDQVTVSIRNIPEQRSARVASTITASSMLREKTAYRLKHLMNVKARQRMAERGRRDDQLRIFFGRRLV